MEQRLGEQGEGVDRIITPCQRWTFRGYSSATCVVYRSECIVCCLSFLLISKGLIKIALFYFCMPFIHIHAKLRFKCAKRALLSFWTNRLYNSAYVQDTLAEHMLYSSVYIENETNTRNKTGMNLLFVTLSTQVVCYCPHYFKPILESFKKKKQETLSNDGFLSVGIFLSCIFICMLILYVLK